MTSPHLVLGDRVEGENALTAEEKAEVRKYLRERIPEEVKEIRAVGTREGE